MGMSARKRVKISGLFGLGALSSATMLWLFWHFPLGTGVATLVVLAALGLSAHLARWIDTEGLSDLRGGKRHQV
jgi:hypothetical protein